MFSCQGSEGAGMMASQMMASEGGERGDLEGKVAVTYTKTCFVFQEKRDLRSVRMVRRCRVVG